VIQPAANSAPRKRRAGLAFALSVAAALLVAGMAWGYYAYYPGLIGAEQPIPFSHRFHVTGKRVSCIFCHPGAIDTERAGVPPLETCMLCHKHIITTYPQIKILRRHYDERRPVEWVRANAVPEFVYFNHSVHLRAGFDCGRCHGDVAGMDRVVPAPEITMGFCVQCHRDEEFSHDCLICHR